MNRRPDSFGQPDRVDPDLERIVDELERYAAAEKRGPPLDLAGRIRAAVEAAPDPDAGWRIPLAALLRAWRAPARGLAMAAVLVVAVVGALAVGQLIDQARRPDIGTSPSPAIVSPSPSISPTVTPSPSASPSPSPSPSPTPTPPASATPTPPVPSPSGSDELETPEPSDSDNSGPGGSGGDNSGPGGGGGDNSGPGGGGGDNSGPGGGGD